MFFDEIFNFNSKHFIVALNKRIKHFCVRYQEQLAVPPHRFLWNVQGVTRNHKELLKRFLKNGCSGNFKAECIVAYWQCRDHSCKISTKVFIFSTVLDFHLASLLKNAADLPQAFSK